MTGGLTEGIRTNAWLVDATIERGELLLAIGLHARLRGADQARLLIREPSGVPTGIEIAPAALGTSKDGEIVARFAVALADVAALDPPGATAIMVRPLSIELGGDRRARIASGAPEPASEAHVGGRTIRLARRGNGDLALATFRQRFVRPAEVAPGRHRRHVLICLQSFSGEAGANKALIQIAGALVRAGHATTIVTLAPSNEPPRFPIPTGVGLDHATHPFARPPVPMPPHLQSEDLDPNLAAYLAATDADVVICTIRRAVPFRRVLPAQTILLLSDHDGRRADMIAAGTCDRVYLDALAASDAVHVVDPLIADAVRSITDRPVTAVGNVVEPPPPRARPASRIFETRRIVAIGRLVPVKRMHHIIDAFAGISAARPGWSLDIFGSGPEEAALQDRIAAHGLNDRATLRGFDPDVSRILAEGAVLVSGSRIESFGLAIAEAMAAGCPVIAYDHAVGARTLLADGAGILVPFGKKRALAKAMAGMCRRIEERDHTVLAMTERAARRVAAFSPEKISLAWGEMIGGLQRRPYA